MNRLLVGMRLKVAGLLIAFTLSLSALYASVPVQVGFPLMTDSTCM
jgi:hypothetical protein